MKRIFGLILIIAALAGCGSQDEYANGGNQDVTNHFLSVTLGTVYKQENTEMIFYPDYRLVQKNFGACKYAIHGTQLKVSKYQNSEAVQMSYTESDIQPIGINESNLDCVAYVENYRAQLPKSREMIFCGYTRSGLDATCGNNELSALNWQ